MEWGTQLDEKEAAGAACLPKSNAVSVLLDERECE